MIDERDPEELVKEQEAPEARANDFFKCVPVLGRALLKEFVTDDELFDEIKLGVQRADVAGFAVPEIVQAVNLAELEAGLVEETPA